MRERDWRKWALITFKYCPVITAFAMFIHTGLCLFGIVLGFAETFCGLSFFPLIIAYCLSKGLGFCNIHRMFIDYTFKVYLCIQWQTWIGFGPFLTLFRVVILLLGAGIFAYFVANIKRFYNCKPLRIDRAPIR